MGYFNSIGHQSHFAQIIVDEAVEKAHQVRTLLREGANAVEIDRAINVANQSAREAAPFLKLVGDRPEQLRQATRLLSPEERWA